MKSSTGTTIFCRRCGSETKSDMVPAGMVNDLRAAATQLLEIMQNDQAVMDSPVYDKPVEKLRGLC